ncbi:MAG TPA: IS110 family transposase [Vicinamibacterales bacterium]|nr:IS110 family transposase [Vicinamibacterales bacterium]
MTRPIESAPTGGMLMAFELGQRSWKLGFTVGMGQRPRVRQIPAGAVDALATEITRAKKRLGLSADAPVTSCYEAGRDGFWLHRYLVAMGVTNYVVDSSSIEVNRRARRAKTDSLDLAGLLSLLARYALGDQRAWRVVRVPTVAEEDARHLPRTLEALTQDRTRLVNRLKSLLATQGLSLPINAQFLKRLSAARLWDGAPVPPGLQERLTRTWTQLEEVDGQMRDLKALHLTRPEQLPPATSRALAQLLTVRAIGPIGASVLATEIFGWRRIRNGRELGALVGLVPAPYQSGQIDYDQGITRAGNAHVRRVMVQLAWGWIRHQPDSALTHWYQQRFGGGGTRVRKIGIVALARRLLIALWRYLETGAVPDGAQLKPIGV